MANAFRQVKWNWNVLVKHQESFNNKEYEKSTLKHIFENYIDDQGIRLANATANPYGQSREQWVDEKVRKFKEAADISNSVLNIYINVVSKQQFSLTLFERRPVLDVTIVLLRKVVFAEGTYALELIQELLEAFFFDQVEEVDPYRLFNTQTLPTLMVRNVY